HAVTNLKGAIKHDRDAGNESRHQVAHREADRKSQGAADHSHCRLVEPDADAQADPCGTEVDRKLGERLKLLDQKAMTGEPIPQSGGDFADDSQDQRRRDHEKDREKHPSPADEVNKLTEVGRFLSPSQSWKTPGSEKS